MTYRIACSIALFLMVVLPGCRTIENEEAQNTFDQAAFASADTDGNGRLTEHELALHKHREALAEFDLDSDNHISAAEWAAARPGAGEQDEHFNKLDKNSDGTVSKQESVLFITEHVSFGDMFKKYDANGDYHLHWEEIDEGAPTEMNITLFSLHPDS
jgi:Ca2+-binding EF-hand superfamily protein